MAYSLCNRIGALALNASRRGRFKIDDGDIEPAIQPFMILKLGCMQVKCGVCSRGVNEVYRLDEC